MKRLVLFSLLAMLLLTSIAAAAGDGGDITPIFTPEQFGPRVFLDPHSRIVIDDCNEPGAIYGGMCTEELVERIENYAFEGEQIIWDVLVWDKNGIDKVTDVFVTLNDEIEANCHSVSDCVGTPAEGSCSAYTIDQCSAIDGCAPIVEECEEYIPPVRATPVCDRYVDGNTQTACGGLTPCHLTLQAAVDAAASGEVICVYDGTYGYTTVTKPVTLYSLNLHGAVIDGATNGLYVNADDVTIDGFEITGNSYAISLHEGDNIADTINIQNLKVLNCNIHDNILEGIGMLGGSQVTGLLVENSQFSRNMNAIGISGGSVLTDLTVRGCTIDAGTNHGIYLGFVSPGGTLNNALIEHTTITNSLWEGFHVENSVVNGLTMRCSTLDSNGGWGFASVKTSQLTDVLFDRVTIANNGYGVGGSGASFVGLISNIRVTGSTFSGNEPLAWNSDIDVGVSWLGAITTASNIQIDHNNFAAGGANVGVRIDPTTVFTASDIVISQNNILNGVNNGAATPVNAENNWWGCAEGPGNIGCSAAVNVDYDPWLTGEYAVCGGTPSSCGIFNNQNTCEQTDGCSWYGSLRNADVWEGEEHVIDYNPRTMQWYQCAFTVETPASMHGEYVIVANARDLFDLTGQSVENEYWFLNPVVALGMTGSVNFGTVRPGATVKSTSLRITNEAEAGSGVLLDMYIAGTDFYDPSHSDAMCPDSNVLRLGNFRYYAALGAYKTCTHNEIVPQPEAEGPAVDSECYVTIPYYVDGAGDPGNNGMQRIIAGTTLLGGEYPAGNVLSPGADISINFKLKVPEPCNGGTFSQGTFKIFGEAI